MRFIHTSILAMIAILPGCSTNEQKQKMLAQQEEAVHELDAFLESTGKVLKAHANCLQNEANSKKLDRLDLETAAHAIVATCIEFDNQYRDLTRHYFRQNPKFHTKMHEGADQRTMDFAKKLIAYKRANY